MRNHRFVLAVIFTCATAAVGASPARAQQAPVPIQPRISTTGTGEAHVTPDRATIFVGVQSRAATAAAAAADNARRQRAVLDTLRALGLPSTQLSTVNYNVSPEMQYNQTTGTSRVTGYVVSNSVRAEVRRLNDVARVIDAALAKGANEISSLQFSSSKADSARRAALADAVANARAEAEVLARAAGGRLGDLIELTTAMSPIRPVPEMAMARMAASAPPTPIEPGQQSISASVTALWAFVKE